MKKILGFLSSTLQVSSAFTSDDNNTSAKSAAAPWVAGLSLGTFGITTELSFIKTLRDSYSIMENFRDKVNSHFGNILRSLLPAGGISGGLWFLTGMEGDQAILIGLSILALNHTLAELGLLGSAQNQLSEHADATKGNYVGIYEQPPSASIQIDSFEAKKNKKTTQTMNRWNVARETEFKGPLQPIKKNDRHLTMEFEAPLAKRIRNTTLVKLIFLYVVGGVTGYVYTELRDHNTFDNNFFDEDKSSLRPFQVGLTTSISLNGIADLLVHFCVAKRRPTPEIVGDNSWQERSCCPSLCD